MLFDFDSIRAAGHQHDPDNPACLLIGRKDLGDANLVIQLIQVCYEDENRTVHHRDSFAELPDDWDQRAAAPTLQFQLDQVRQLVAPGSDLPLSTLFFNRREYVYSAISGLPL